MADGLEFEPQTHQFNRDVQKILRKFGKDAPQVLSTELEKIGKHQTKLMKQRLKNLGSVGRNVAKKVNMEITGHSKDNIAIINIGADPAFGKDRAENVNFSAILGEGIRTFAAVGDGKQTKYMAGGKKGQSKGLDRGFFKGGYWKGGKPVGFGKGKIFKVGQTYGSPQPPKPEMFPKAIELTEKAIERDLGPALERQWVKYNKLFKERR